MMRPFGADLQTVVLAGVVAGGVDVFSAALINRVSPAFVCRAIASGVMGGKPFKQALK